MFSAVVCDIRGDDEDDRFQERGRKAARRAAGAARETVFEGLAIYAVEGRGDVNRLQGHEGFRLRIGRYRVLFDEDATTILAVYIGKRETATYR